MFELLQSQKTKLNDVVVLSQKNRQPDDNPGAKLSFEMDVPNHVLSYFDGMLKGFLFTKNASSVPTATKRNDTATGTLDGVEQVSDLPNLSTIGSKVGWLKWDAELSGYELLVVLGVARKQSNLEIADCVLSKFRFRGKDGGSVTVKFTLESQDVSEQAIGKLAKLKSREVDIQLRAPEVVQQDIDDGSDDEKPAAPRKPAAAERAAVAKAGATAPDAGRAATEAFAQGAGDPPPDDEGSEAGDTDISGSDAAWPFPKKASTEAPPQSVTIETSRPGTRTARGRDRTKAALAAREGAAS